MSDISSVKSHIIYKKTRILAILIFLSIVASAVALPIVPASASDLQVKCTYASLNSFSAGSQAECMITIEAGTNRVLYGQNIHKKRPMASVTKILTAITVIENCPDLSAKRQIPAAAEGIEGSSIYLAGGEMISTLDLLYGLMLQSGNDCAVALAILTSGSVPAFAALMNKTATKAGAINSNFVNPHGLHHDEHCTTAYDLALITSHAMKNPVFKEIVSTKSRKIERTRENAPTLILNKNKILSTFKGGDGVKTGFTKRAGRCLVSSATRDGMQVITVVLNCGPMFEECSRLMSLALKEYKLTRIAEARTAIAQTDVADGKVKTVSVGISRDLYYPLKAGETVSVLPQVPAKVTAPIKKGKEIGTVNFILGNRLLFEEKLYTIEDAPGLNLEDYLKHILTEW